MFEFLTRRFSSLAFLCLRRFLQIQYFHRTLLKTLRIITKRFPFPYLRLYFSVSSTTLHIVLCLRPEISSKTIFSHDILYSIYTCNLRQLYFYQYQITLIRLLAYCFLSRVFLFPFRSWILKRRYYSFRIRISVSKCHFRPSFSQIVFIAFRFQSILLRFILECSRLFIPVRQLFWHGSWPILGQYWLSKDYFLTRCICFSKDLLIGEALDQQVGCQSFT